MKENVHEWDLDNGVHCEQIEGDDTRLYIHFERTTDLIKLEGVIQYYFEDGYESIKVKGEGDARYTLVNRNDVLGSLLFRKK